MRVLAGILRVAIGLDRSYEARVQRINVTIEPDRVLIEAIARPGADVSLELYAADERSALFAETLGRRVEFAPASGRSRG